MNGKRSEIVPRETLESLSTAVLQEMLDRELDVDSPEAVNVALIKEITTILGARTGESEIDVDAAYEELVSEYLDCEMLYPADEFESDEEAVSVKPMRRRRRFGRTVLIAAVFVLLFVVTVQATGLDLLGALARWTEETFEFKVTENSPTSTISSDQFTELVDVLLNDGITPSFVPRFLPEGYEFQRIDAGHGEYCAVYEKDGEALLIQIHLTQNGNATRMEKNAGEPEVYVVNEIEHHIVSNLELYSVTWVSEGYECTIFGIPTIDDAYEMIDSIYWED